MASETIGDIIEAVQEERPVDDVLLRSALLSLYYCLQLSCPSDYAGKPQVQLEWRAKENFERLFRILRAEPQMWLGERYTPGTEANKKGREQSKKILAAFEAHRDVKGVK